MHHADYSGFLQRVHPVIKGIDDTVDRNLTADLIKGRGVGR
jgi:hypothetical protein